MVVIFEGVACILQLAVECIPQSGVELAVLVVVDTGDREEVYNVELVAARTMGFRDMEGMVEVHIAELVVARIVQFVVVVGRIAQF